MLHVDLLAEELRQPTPDSPEEITQILTEIQVNLARVDDLMQDYLSLVRVGAIERTPHNLWETVQTWVPEWQTLATANGVILQLDGVERLGCVAFHESTLRRAILNLVHNALDAMPHGGTLTLTGQRTATHAELHVRDTGSGIPAERLAQIFEPLYTTKAGGDRVGAVYRAGDCGGTCWTDDGAKRGRPGHDLYNHVAGHHR